MKKVFGLAVLPVMLAASPLLALAEDTLPHDIAASPKQQQAQQQNKQTKQVQPASQAQAQSLQSQQQMSAMDPQSKQQLQQAQQNLINKRYTEAATNYQSLLSKNPNHIHALNGLAMAQFAQGRFEEALQTIDKAIASDPINSKLYYTRAQILDAQDKPMEAVETYLTFAAMSPDDTSALTAQRRVNELYKRIQPNLSQAQKHYMDGLYMLSLHQPEQAIVLLEQYKKLEPNNPNASLFLGRAYLEQGQTQQAIAQFQSAVQLKANNPIAYYQLGNSYDQRGDAGNAKEAYRKFLQFAPQSESAMELNQRVQPQ